MLPKIIHFSVNNKLIVVVFTIALIVWGTWSASQLPVDALPDVTNNQVQVITRAPTLAAQEVEQFITYPIEKSLSNIQGLVEMRSFSRFGLSVITLVFEEQINVYFARQLIAEKLKDAEGDIPKGTGTPELGPVTTGLGEIYQYVIHPKKGSEQKYSAMDLRTMQDWIVGRQLSGIRGVAEITGFGGINKQYEVAVNPDRLKAMNVTIPEILSALEKNNENTGGAYIDSKPNAYFIRGVGLIKTFADIENIVIKHQGDAIPVLVRDVATVQFGSPPRYGVLTYNGEKEVVGGIVLMMKGANSASVVKLVKERMKTVQKSLPEDIIIEAFLDRTNLIDRAIHTVKTNLIEGALIVILVLVLFLGNLRAGLIVASAIPLSLLFALALMNLFGVSANLMSLGAIDFGLIVDGAVIIVEASLHFLSAKKQKDKFTQQQMDTAVEDSAGRMMSSAAFGQVIILVVYLPILSLQGIEGKMFRPMAETVVFAIIGALILSVTYIPVMSAVFLSNKIKSKQTFADKMMDFFQRVYTPLIKGAVKIKYIVVAIAVGLLIISIVLFRNMGGEFIPTLEEGDYAIEFVLPQGSSLSQTTETVMLAERMLRTFPEVKMVVGKTGSADVATDPMPPEASDLIVILKPKRLWTTTGDFYELAAKMKVRLSNIPGVIAEPSQPIQMRFNELMTGIRQDVAIKIFGEDLDSLVAYGAKVANTIRSINGVTQPQVERVDGLPQITVEYDRARLAGYGLNIEDVNHVISTAFAGKVAGAVYENERKFDLVVRLDSSHRTSLEDVSNLYVPMSNGNQIPLTQVATVSFKTGPAQISREAGKRRIYVSFNVSGRDIASVVKEAQQKLAEKVQLPTGYYYTYGGTFENLQKASARLIIVVPLALLLIFFMLYFTFSSIREATLIFSAIPMSAIGGVFALLIRGMPFSISAGVGFIALFGVAVLNGIVLISTFNQLEKEGMHNALERVWEGTKIRLRPVLMTAMVASLGFLPMAISSGAGAEVQKPLATVVIGGLLTATFLTLIVLPCLYILFSKKNKLPLKPLAASIAGSLLVLGSLNVTAQQQNINRLSIESAIGFATNNLQYQVNNQQITKGTAQIKTATPFLKTGLFAENEDLRPSDNKGILKIGLSQSIAWPGLYKAQRNLYGEQLKYFQVNNFAIDLDIKKDVRTVYYQLWYLQDKQILFQRLDSISRSLDAAAKLKVKTGDSPGLDSIAANVRMKEIQALLQQTGNDIRIQQQSLMQLLNTNDTLLPVQKPLEKLPMQVLIYDTAHPLLALQHQNIHISKASIAIIKNENKPEFSGRFFSQRLYGGINPVSGFSVSAAFPLFGTGAYRSKVKTAEADALLKLKQYEYEAQSFSTRQRQAQQEVEKNNSLLSFYQVTGVKQAEEIIKAASLAYRSGEISFAELSQFLSQAIDIQKNYLEVLNAYNQSVIQILLLYQSINTMKNILIKSIIFLVIISLFSCSGKESGESAKVMEVPAEEKHEPSDKASLTSEQIKTIGVQLGGIEQKQLTTSLKTNGVLKVPNQNKASINSVYSGVIRLLLVQPGNTVTKGQVIATIANPEFIQVQDEFLGISAKILLAEQEYTRQKELNEGNAGALKNLQAADNSLKTLLSRKSSLQQQIQLMGINPAALSNGKLVSVVTIRSPISGVVSNVLVKIGSYVDVTTVVAEIVDNSRLHLDLFVYEKDLPRLKNNQTIHFTVTNDPGKEYDAEIFSLGSSFEGESKTVSVHAMVKGNKTGLIDGMSVTATISLDKATLPAIPTEAIVSYQGQDYIFIVDSVDAKNNITVFKRTPIAKGSTDIGYSEITLLNKIPANAQVVVKGSFFILAKQTNVGEEE